MNISHKTVYGSKPSSSSLESADGTKEAQSAPLFLLGDSNACHVKVQHQWKSLVSDNDVLMKGFMLKGRIAVALESLFEALPPVHCWSMPVI